MVFVSGPYSPYEGTHFLGYNSMVNDQTRFRLHYSIDDNIEIAKKYATLLWEMGFTVHCPHLNTAHFEQTCACKLQGYLDGDIVVLKRCDAIFMLPNWKYSKGAKIEYNVAKMRDMKILMNLKEAENWLD